MIFILVVFGAVMFIIPICNHYFVRTYAYDYAAYNFAFYDYAHFKVSANPIYFVENKTFLQDHLSFTFFFFIPLYWALSWLFGTYTLLIIQSCLIIYGGWASYKLIELHTRRRIFAILGLLLYFIMFGRYSSFLNDANLMIMLSSLVPVFLYHFVKGDYKLAVFWFIFLTLGRESIPLWMIFICSMLVILFWKDKKRLKYAIGFIVASLIYFIVSFKYMIPAIEDPERPFDLFNYAALGNTPSEALVYMVTHPIDCIILLFENHSGNSMFDGVKLEFYSTYLISGGILLFLRPKYLLPLIPILLQKMYNDVYIRWSIEGYYAIEFVSLMPILVFFTLHELRNKKISLYLGIAGFVGTIAMTTYKLNPENKVLNTWFESVKYEFYNGEMYSSKYDVSVVNRHLSIIPNEAKVSASLHLTSHLAFRSSIYQFPKVEDAEYIILLKDDNPYPTNKAEVDSILHSYLNSDNWATLANNDDVILLKMKH